MTFGQKQLPVYTNLRNIEKNLSFKRNAYSHQCIGIDKHKLSLLQDQLITCTIDGIYLKWGTESWEAAKRASCTMYHMKEILPYNMVLYSTVSLYNPYTFMYLFSPQKNGVFFCKKTERKQRQHHKFRIFYSWISKNKWKN